MAALRKALQRNREEEEEGDDADDALERLTRGAATPAKREALQWLMHHDAFDISDRAMVAGYTRDAAGFAGLYAAASQVGLAALGVADRDDLFVAACSVGDAQRAVTLLDAGASILATDRRMTFEYAAVVAGKAGHAAVVHALCNRPGALGIAAAFRNDAGLFRDCAIIAAACLGDIGLARRLLEEGANVDAAADGWATAFDVPLFSAAKHGHLEMMRLLRDEWGATLYVDLFEDLVTSESDRPLHHTYRSIITFFIERGMPFRNALHRLCGMKFCDIDGKLVREPSVEQIKLLLELGADVNARYEGRPDISPHYGPTPLFAAIRSGHVEHVTILLDAGADPLDCGGGEVAPIDAVRACGHDAHAAKAMRASIRRAIAERAEN